MESSGIEVGEAQIVSAFNSIQKNGSQYSTLTFYIALLMVIALIALFILLFVLQLQDQSIPNFDTYVICALGFFGIVVLWFSYFGYLRNIGLYVYSRVKPVAVDRNLCQEYKNQLNIQSMIQ